MISIPSRSFASTAIAGLLAFAPALTAQTTLYWDADGTGTVDGGTGTWNTSNTNWSTDDTNSTTSTWTNASPTNDAVFQNTGGTVTLGSNITVRSLTFETDNYTLTGSNILTFDEGTGSIETNGSDTSIDVDIQGNDGLTKSGSSALILSGNNTYTGTTTVTQSTLRISSDDNLGSGQLVLNGGNLLIEGGSPVTLDASRGITASVVESKIFVNGSATTTFAGVIDGVGGLSKDNPGTLILTGNNTYAGPTNIRNGTLSIDGDASLGTAPASATADHLRINGGDLQTTNSFTLNANRGISLSSRGGQILPDVDTTLTYNGTIADDSAQGSGPLILAGNGTLVLGGANTYTGATHVQSGTLQFDNPSALYNNAPASWTPANLTVESGATASFYVNSSTGFTPAEFGTLLTNLNSINDNGFKAGSHIGIHTTGTPTITDDISDSTGTGAGSLRLVKTGSGTLVLSGSNSYTGGTQFLEGRINVDSQGKLGPTPVDTVEDSLTFDGGELRFTATGSVAAKRGITLNAGGGTLSATSGNTLTIGSVIAGTGDLTISGGGTVQLNKPNTFEGTTSVSGSATLALNASDALQNSSVTNLSNLAFVNITTATFGGISGSENLLLENTPMQPVSLSIGNNNIDTSYSGVFSGNGSLIKIGTGTTTLTRNNTFTGGTTLTNGTITASNDNALGTGTLIFNGGALQTNTSRTLDNAITVSDDFTISGSNGVTLSGDIDWGASDRTITVDNTATTTFSGIISGTGRIIKAGDGTLVLSGANEYSGGTQFDAGRINILNDTGLGAVPESVISDHLIFNGGQLRVTTSGQTINANRGITLLAGGGTINQNGGALTINSVITGDGPFTKTGTSKLTLGGINDYTGITTIDQGLLVITADTNLGAAPESVTANQLTIDGGTLSTSGDFTLAPNRGVTIGTNGGTITTASDTLTYSGIITGNGELTKSGSGTLSFGGTLNGSGMDDVSGGDANDLIISEGTLALTSGSSISLRGGNASSGSTPTGNGGDIWLTGGMLDWQDGTIDLRKGDVGSTGGINDGTLTLAGGTLQTTAALLDSAAFQGNFVLTSGTLNLTDTTVTLGSSGTVADALSAAADALNLEVENSLSLEGNFTASSADTLSAGDITITSGNTLNLTASDAITDDPAVTVNSGGTLNLNATTNTIGSLFGAGSVDLGTGTLTTGQDNASSLFSGIISDSSAGHLIKTGTGTFTLTGSNTYTGTTTISGGTLAIGNGGATGNFGTGAVINNGNLTINRSDNLSLSDSISGSGSLTKVGDNTLTLTATNTYSGGTTIDGGTLVLGHPTDTLSDAGHININFGNTLDLGANSDTVGIVNFSRGNITGTGTLTASAFNLHTSAPNTGVVTPILAGTGTALTVTGSGLVTLSGVNTYDGGTILTGGTLALGSSGALGSNGTITFGDGILQFSESNQTDYSDRFSTANNQTFHIDTNGQEVSFSTPLNSASGGSLRKSATGTLALSGANNYDGETNIEHGTLRLLAGASITHTDNDLDIGISDGDDAALQVDATGSVSTDTIRLGVLAGSIGTANIDGILISDDRLIVGQGGTGTFSIADGGVANVAVTFVGSQISDDKGTGTINVSGTFNDGSLGIASVIGSSGNGALNILSGGVTNSAQSTILGYETGVTGTVSVNGTWNAAAIEVGASGIGILTVQSGGIVDSSGNISLASNADSSGTLNIGNASPAGILNALSISSGSGTAIVNFNHTSADHFFTDDGTINGTGIPIQGTISVNHIDSGKTTLTANNNYSGGTTISTGTLSLGHATDTLADTGAIIIDEGTLDIPGSNVDTVGALSLSAGNITGTGSLSGTSYSFTNDDPVSVSATLAGSGALTKSGEGTLTLTGTSTFTGGTTISEGTLSLGHPTDTLANSGAITINDNTLDIGSNSDNVGAVNLSSGTIIGTGTLSPNSITFTDSGSVSAIIGGNSSLTKTGAGTATLSNANTYTGFTRVRNGTLALTSTGSLSIGDHTLSVGTYSGDNGTLEIVAGSSVTAKNTILGEFASDSAGTIIVAGTLINTNGLTVGNNGTGTFNLLTGGSITNHSTLIGGKGVTTVNGTWTDVDLTVGHSGGGNAVFTVEDGGSVFNDQMTIGLAAQGTVNIGNNSIVTVNSGSHSVTLGQLESGEGTINITGSDAPGVLKASQVQCVFGGGNLNFNHTNSNYHFTKNGTSSGGNILISGATELNHIGTGTTTLSGDHTYTGDTTISAGQLIVTGMARPSNFIVETGGTVSGTGSIGALTIDVGGTVAPGASAGTLNARRAVIINGTYECEIDGASADQLDANNNLDITNATLDISVLSGGITESAYVIASYGSLTGAEFATLNNLPAGMILDYAYNDGSDSNNIALVNPLFDFDQWAQARGLTVGVNDGLNDDPNGDGRTNLEHFAFDTDPLGDGSDEGKRLLTFEDVDGISYVTFTIPVRAGATYSGDPLTSDLIDGLIYSIHGDSDLEDPWDLEVVELTSALSTGLASLGDYDGETGADWEYRSFRLTSPAASLPRAFMKAEATSTAP